MMEETEANKLLEKLLGFIRDDLKSINDAIDNGDIPEMVLRANELAADASVFMGAAMVVKNLVAPEEMGRAAGRATEREEDQGNNEMGSKKP